MNKAAAAFAAGVCAVALTVVAQPVSVERVPVRDTSGGSPSAEVAPAPAAPAVKPAVPARAPAGRTLRLMTSFAAPPFSFKEGMKEIGFEYDLGEALGKEMGAKVDWVPKKFSITTYTSALDSGAADAAISAISITDRRKRSLAFTRPYFKASLAVATLKDITWKSNNFRNGLRNWLVGVVRGTTGERWARKNLNCTIKTYSSPTRLAQALSSAKPSMLRKDLKKVDPAVAELLGAAPKWKAFRGDTGFCILHDDAVITWLLSSRGYKFKIVEKEFAQELYGIAVSKRKPELLAELNAALESLDKKGIYDKIYQKWYAQARDLPLFTKK